MSQTKVSLETLRKLEASGAEGQLIAQGFYKSIFSQVQDRKDWKAPIDYRFHEGATAYDLDVIRHAVVFYTGNDDCAVAIEGSYIHVTSQGYRAGPCGP